MNKTLQTLSFILIIFAFLISLSMANFPLYETIEINGKVIPLSKIKTIQDGIKQVSSKTVHFCF